jgi:hypothetical protein
MLASIVPPKPTPAKWRKSLLFKMFGLWLRNIYKKNSQTPRNDEKDFEER